MKKQAAVAKDLTTADGLLSANTPSVPPPPPAPVPAKKPPISTQAIVMATLGLVAAGLTVSAYSPRVRTLGPDHWRDVMTREEHREKGLEALRRQDFAVAGHHFVEAGDDVRLGEVYFHEGKYDDAVALFDKHHGDKIAKFLLARIAGKRGDHARAERLLVESKNLGCHAAESLLAQPNWHEKV